MGILDKMKNMASKNKEQSQKLSDAAERQVNQRTGGKYKKQVDTAQQQAEKKLGFGRGHGGGREQQ
ncbi:antitoxin [Streptomyces sp. NPDC057245]|uniref:antitoxin n=1 Tax=Streptomyces TaxID=1883 RepID=UPI001C1E6C6D|nr:antitoxin [Streptomyces sp. A108]MBU6534957.1 antitoxin [Streptomyces sp. A108]